MLQRCSGSYFSGVILSYIVDPDLLRVDPELLAVDPEYFLADFFTSSKCIFPL